MKLVEVLHMNGGIGDISYANNSLLQVNININYSMNRIITYSLSLYIYIDIYNLIMINYILSDSNQYFLSRSPKYVLT